MLETFSAVRLQPEFIVNLGQEPGSEALSENALRASGVLLSDAELRAVSGGIATNLFIG